jgi:glutathione S-transferase
MQRDNASQTMSYLGSELAETEVLAASDFSMANTAAFLRLAYVDVAKLELAADLRKLTALRQRIEERPSNAA